MAFTLEPRAVGGWLSYSAVSTAAAVFTQQIVSGPAKLGPVNIGNATTGNIYARLYDSAVAPTLGTTPPVKRLLVPASDNITIGGDGFEGIPLTNGAWIYVSKGIGDTDATALTAKGIFVNVNYVKGHSGYSA